jgi:hypothetical protein
MATKEKNNNQISAADAVIKTAIDPNAAQMIAKQAIAKAQATPLKAQTETRLQSEAGLLAKLNGSAVTTENQKPTEEQTDLDRWIYLQRTKQNDILNAEAFDDINYHLLPIDEINKKGQLTKDELLAADTRDPKIAGMAVLRVDSDKSSSYYVGDKLSNYLASHPQHTGRMTNIGEAQRAAYQESMVRANVNVDFGGPTLLNPRLAKAMRDNPTVAGYVEMTMNAAKRHGLDPVMLANQFYQESKFNPNAVSPAGARGISQMMPFQQGKYGLTSADDFSNPAKSIEAGASMMAHLTNKIGDQRLALVAYNGGGKAIDFVEKSLGKAEVTFNEWKNFMTTRRETLGVKDRGAWHNETLGYVEIIAGTPSEPKKQNRVVAAALPDRQPA